MPSCLEPSITEYTYTIEPLLGMKIPWLHIQGTVSVLGRDEGYTVKYNPLPEGVSEGKARGNS